MAIQNLTTLQRETVADISKQKGEPAWMTERRIQAWQLYTELPLPHYERTKLKEMDLEGFLPYGAGQAVAATREELAGEVRAGLDATAMEGNLLVQHNSDEVFAAVQADLRSQGVILCSLDQAVRDHPDLVEKYFMTDAVKPADSRLAALNGALWSGGTFVYVPKGVAVDVPLQAFLWVDTPGLGIFDHTLVVADAESQVTIIEAAASAGNADKVLRSALVEVYAGQGARVRYCSVQNLGPKVDNYVTRRGVTGQDASIEWVLNELGSGRTVAVTDSRLDGKGSESRNLTLFFADGTQHLDVQPRMYHVGEMTSSDIMVKGVVKDRARCAYGPMTHIDLGAREGNAFQRGNTLVLNPDARAHSLPQLVVIEDEVQGAGHAATIGQVDKEQVFYLRSRGLNESQAKKVIVDGFLNPMVDRIPVEAVREQVRALVDGKMPA